MKTNTGFTLIELMVALALSVLIAGLVYVSWNSITRHTTVHQRRTQLDTDAQRIGRQISGDIRRSPAILALESSRVSLISPLGGDTLTYVFANNTITRNNTLMPLQSHNARIESFTLTSEHGDPSSASSDVLITLAIKVTSTFGDTSALNFKVRAKEPKETQSGGIKGWNY